MDAKVTLGGFIADFVKEKDTTGTVKYKEDDEFAAKIGSLYIKKHAFVTHGK